MTESPSQVATQPPSAGSPSAPPPARELGPTPQRPLPSRSGPLGLLTAGGLLLLLAALCAWVLPNVLVYGPQQSQMETMPADGDYHWDYIQSGQTSTIPADQRVSVQPDWVHMDPAMMPTDGSEPQMPDYTCAITAPDGSTVSTTWDQHAGLSFDAIEGGAYTISCDGDGMLNVNGQPLSEMRRWQSWETTLRVLAWSSWIALASGIALSVLGAYLLGSKNQQRRYALQEVYASVPLGTQPAGAPSASGQPTSYGPPPVSSVDGGPQASSSASPPAAPAYDSGLNPHIPRNSDTYQVRPREVKRKSKDPFDEN
ncbi:MAG: hypothetical protein Q4G64_06165 [bacterium]|nr:hypothetical protein [bacterium]